MRTRPRPGLAPCASRDEVAAGQHGHVRRGEEVAREARRRRRGRRPSSRTRPRAARAAARDSRGRRTRRTSRGTGAGSRPRAPRRSRRRSRRAARCWTSPSRGRCGRGGTSQDAARRPRRSPERRPGALERLESEPITTSRGKPSRPSACAARQRAQRRRGLVEVDLAVALVGDDDEAVAVGERRRAAPIPRASSRGRSGCSASTRRRAACASTRARARASQSGAKPFAAGAFTKYGARAAEEGRALVDLVERVGAEDERVVLGRVEHGLRDGEERLAAARAPGAPASRRRGAGSAWRRASQAAMAPRSSGSPFVSG